MIKIETRKGHELCICLTYSKSTPQVFWNSLRLCWRLYRYKTISDRALPRTQTSFFWWKCARKGRREGDNGRDALRLPSVPFPWSLAVHHQSLVSRSPLPCEKRSAWGGGWDRASVHTQESWFRREAAPRWSWKWIFTYWIVFCHSSSPCEQLIRP